MNDIKSISDNFSSPSLMLVFPKRAKHASMREGCWGWPLLNIELCCCVWKLKDISSVQYCTSQHDMWTICEWCYGRHTTDDHIKMDECVHWILYYYVSVYSMFMHSFFLPTLPSNITHICPFSTSTINENDDDDYETLSFLKFSR